MLLLQLRVYPGLYISGVSSNNKINKPTTTATTTTTTTMTTTMAAVALDTPHVTPVPTNNSATSLGSLFNAIIHRRVTLRPASRNVHTLQQSSTPKSAADTSLVESPAARTVHDKDTNSNVVYVTAIGASSDQQAIAYVNSNAGFNADQMSHDGTTRAEVNYSPTFDLLHEDDLSTDSTTSNISQEQ
jgi:hypothetical protein